jgi:hypothetical protein
MKTLLRGTKLGLMAAMGIHLLTSVATGQTTNAPGIYPLTGQASAPGTFTNFVMVSKTGSDASGARNNYGLPFATITAAKAAAVAGDTIFVLPGVYQEHNLLKPLVNYDFAVGVKLQWLCSTNTKADAYGLFDERGSGPTTNRISGTADCYFSCGTNYDAGVPSTGNTNCVGGVLTVTNDNTRIDAEFHDVGGDAFEDSDGLTIDGQPVVVAIFYIARTARTDIRVHDMACPLRDWTTAQSVIQNGTGLYWQKGETYFTAEHIGPWTPQTYAIWPNDLSTDQHTDNLWVRAGQCEGYIYASINSTNVRCWYSFDELKVTNNVTGMSVIGGKQYVRAMKISSSAGVAFSSSLADTWVTAQKITAPSGGAWITCDSGNLYVKCQQYECPSGALSAGGGFAFAIGGLARITLDGGECFADGLGIKWSVGAGYNNASLLVVKNLCLDTSKANNAGNNSISVGTNGVIVVGSRFKVPAAATASITAAAPQTVGTYWSAANVTTNGNITFTPNAGWTVNAAVR